MFHSVLRKTKSCKGGKSHPETLLLRSTRSFNSSASSAASSLTPQRRCPIGPAPPPSEDNSPGTRHPSATGLGKALGGRAAGPPAGPQGRLWRAWPCGYRWRGAAGTALLESAPPASHSSGCRCSTPPSPTWRQTGQKVEGRWGHGDISSLGRFHPLNCCRQGPESGFGLQNAWGPRPLSIWLCRCQAVWPQGGHLITPLTPHLKNGYNTYLNPGTLHILEQAFNPSKPQLPHLYIKSTKQL